MTNGVVTSQIANQLYFENRDQAFTTSTNIDEKCFSGLQQRAMSRSGIDIYGQDTDSVKQSVAMSFWLPDKHTTLFGIPEREDTLAIETTTGSDPY